MRKFKFEAKKGNFDRNINNDTAFLEEENRDPRSNKSQLATTEKDGSPKGSGVLQKFSARPLLFETDLNMIDQMERKPAAPLDKTRGSGEISTINALPIQRKIQMKDSGPAYRTTLDEKSLSDEVAATIARGDLTEINADIYKLEQSIENRTNDQKGRYEFDSEYGSHQHRIEVEEGLLQDLRDAKKKMAKPRKKKSSAPKKKPAAKPEFRSSNPFDALANL